MQALTVRNLSKTFGRKNKALKDVSVNVSEGEMVALIGASGSGKSTLLRHIAGLVEGDASAKLRFVSSTTPCRAMEKFRLEREN